MALPQDVHHVSALTALLQARGKLWEEALAQGPRLKVAVNQSMTTQEAAIKDGDEIAFFPPVTGG